MANVKDRLKKHNLTDEEVANLLTNPNLSAAITEMLEGEEKGITALQRAQTVEESLKRFNDEQVLPYVNKADAETRAAKSQVAQYQTYLKTLKDQGYDVPDAMLEGAAVTPNNPAPVPTLAPAKGNSDEMLNYARANMALISMSERARDLLGHGLDVEREYEEFGTQARPGENLRNYIDRKYDLSGKQTARDAEKQKAKEDGLREEGRKAALAEYQSKFGNNPETRNPMQSRFDRIAAERRTDKETNNNWQTKQGRDQATNDRISKYVSATVN